jgi:cell division protein FtsW (lipid II flippase)
MPLLIVTGLLLLYGILALFSVSVHESFTTTLSLINKWILDGDPSNYFFFFKQVKNFAYVAVVAYIIYLFPLKALKNPKFLSILSIIIFIFQLLVFTPLWSKLWGARWWLDLPWLPSIQPSEFFKLWYVIFISRWLIRKQHLLNSWTILKRFFIMNWLILSIFLLIPDLWSVLVMWLTSIIMTIYAWVSLKNIWRMLWIWIIWFGIGMRWLMSINNSFCTIDGNQNIDKSSLPSICRYTYITKRFDVFLWIDEDTTGRNTSRQNRQAIIAIWGWGFRWKWYGKGLQKFWYIPEAQSDFIFAAFAEETWFRWIILLFSLYGALIYYSVIEIPKVRDQYFKLISIWLISLLTVEVFVHVGVNIQLLPNTWLTLPFISYGWTSLMTSIIAVMLLYKILYVSPHKLN